MHGVCVCLCTVMSCQKIARGDRLRCCLWFYVKNIVGQVSNSICLHCIVNGNKDILNWIIIYIQPIAISVSAVHGCKLYSCVSVASTGGGSLYSCVSVASTGGGSLYSCTPWWSWIIINQRLGEWVHYLCKPSLALCISETGPSVAGWDYHRSLSAWTIVKRARKNIISSSINWHSWNEIMRTLLDVHATFRGSWDRPPDTPSVRPQQSHYDYELFLNTEHIPTFSYLLLS
jgi:hypothetical protein